MKRDHTERLPAEENTIPDHVIESLARSVLPSLEEFFASEEGQRAFEAWKAQKDGDVKE